MAFIRFAYDSAKFLIDASRSSFESAFRATNIEKLNRQLLKAESADEVKHLVASGANINATNSQQSSVLMEATIRGNLSVVDALLELGVDTDNRNIEGSTALIVAARYNRTKILRVLLLRSSTNINIEDLFGMTALSLASWRGNCEAISILLANGANIDSETNNGWTPLMHATESDRIDAMNLLLAAGADVNTKTNNGNKAIHFAKSVEAVNILIIEGADIEAIGSNNETLLQQLLANLRRNEKTDRLIEFLRTTCGVEG